MSYIEKSLKLSVTSELKFPLMLESTRQKSALERTVYFIFESIGLEAFVPSESEISYGTDEWQMYVEIRGSKLLSDSDSATAEFHWNIEAVISYPSDMEVTSDEILQEINWVVSPNTVWDDEIEVTSITPEVI